MTFLDRRRLQQLMQRDRLDVMVVVTGHNFHFASGYQSYWLQPGRPVGRTVAIVPADPGLHLAVVCGDFEASIARAHCEIADQRWYPTWHGTLDLAEIQAGTISHRDLPVQFDRGINYRVVADVLRDRGLSRARIGVELAHLSQQAYTLLCRENAEASVHDSEGTWADVRAIKTPAEVELIRQAVALAEAGISSVVGPAVRGLTLGEIRLQFVKGVLDAALARPTVQGYQLGGITNLSFGPRTGPSFTPSPETIKDGDLLKFDVGAIVSGYGSDLGRTFSVGRASGLVRRIQDALLAGLDAAVSVIRPGVRLCDVYAAGMAAVRSSGVPYYSRGHLGHTIGAMGGAEEPPFISPGETRVVEPGMVLAVEVPAYIEGLGSFQNEHNLVVNETGFELLDALPVKLGEL